MTPPSNPAALGESQTVLAVEGIEKSFPGVRALKNVGFDVRPGEIHALVGENGAGKSTLMRILAGVYQADAGVIRVGDRPVTVATPADSLNLGIAMVYQDTRLATHLDVAWNIALGHEPGGGFFVDRAAMNEAARQVLDRLGADIDVTRPAADLSRAESQYVEIARALQRDARVLILDEPTSALTSRETERLFDLLRDLRQQGHSIVFISHRIPEVLEIADRITVLKDGEVVGTVLTGEADEDTIVGMMVGRSVDVAFPPHGHERGSPLLEVKGLSAGGVRDISFTLHAGEILGFGGVQGAGQQAAARAMFGLDFAGGEIVLGGHAFRPHSAHEAIEAGLIYVPADRRDESLFLPHGVRENIALPHLSRWSRLGVVATAEERDSVSRQCRQLEIRTPSLEQPVDLLSGGNQQKVVFARWFLAKPRVYVLDEPTQGVDVATKLEIYRLIRSLADEGAGVIVVSSDIIELIGLSDRILVFSDGQIADEVAAEDATEERVIGAATVRKSEAPAEQAEVRRARRSNPLRTRYMPTLLLALVLAVLVAGTASVAPYFLTGRNMSSLAIQVAPLALTTLGQLVVILLAGIDLSVGPLISLTTAVASIVLAPDSSWPMAAGVMLCLLIGAAVGVTNGLLVTKLKVPDLIATLATYSIVQGIALIVRPAPGGLIEYGFMDAVTARIGGIPVAFAIIVILFVLAEWLLMRGRVGGWLYSSGASREAATVTGIDVVKVRVGAYVFCSLMATLAGLIIAARIGSGDPQAGTTFTLASVTAVIVGGGSIFGGVGTAIGAFLGACLIMLMQNALNQLHVSAYWQYIWTGALTLVAVSFYALRSSHSRSAMRERLAHILKR